MHKQVFLLTTDTQQFTSACHSLKIKVIQSQEMQQATYILMSANFNSLK